jgi:hypothetical protein
MLGLPIYFNYLEELFQNTAVDGSTSTIAGFTKMMPQEMNKMGT